MLLLGLTLLAFSVVIYLGVENSLHAQFDHAFEQEVTRFLQESEIEDDNELDLELEVLSHGERVAVYSPDGVLQSFYEGPPGPGQGKVPEGTDSYVMDGVPWRRTTVWAPHLNLWLQVSRSQEELERSLHSLFWFLLAGVPLTVLAAGAGGLFLASRLLNPLDRITRAAATLGAEGLSQRLAPLDSGDELARLVETFNGMLGRLDEAFARQKQFTSDAAHELRTPLARLLMRAEVTLSRPRSSQEYQDSVSEIKEGLQGMTVLVIKLLTLSRADAGALRGEQETLDLADLVSDAVASLEPEEAEPTVETRLQPALVRGDQTRLTELVLNLLQNAQRHAPRDGLVRVEVRVEGQSALLAVSDNGPGVPSAHRERIFERFYQVDESRHTGGAGLGLAICRAIARQHGGELTLEPGELPGARFVARLPLQPSGSL